MSDILGIGSLLNDDDADVSLMELDKTILGGKKADPIDFDDDIFGGNDQKYKKPAPDLDFDNFNLDDRHEALNDIFGKLDKYAQAPPQTHHAVVRAPSPITSVPNINWRNQEMRESTVDQHKNNVINNVMRTIPQVQFDLQKENEEDDKASLLEEIDMLVGILTEEQVPIDRIKLPDMSCSLDEIKKIHLCLKIKNNKMRTRLLAEESILVCSYGAEYLFDGKKEYFGRRPDLTGWADTVHIKLRRMRFDTSRVVNGFINHYNFGPVTRIAMELLPSLILYSNTRRRHRNDNIMTSDKMQEAFAQISSIDRT